MPENGRPPHILFVDHAPEVLELLRSLLEGEGYQVTKYLAVERDIETIANMDPDLIAIDDMWASHGNGWTLLTMVSLDPRTRHLPVVLCTAEVGRGKGKENHLASPALTLVPKPFDIEDLLDAIQARVQERRPAM